MSLINDALKRARLAQKNLAPPPAATLPLRPVEPSLARPARSLRLASLALAAPALVVAGLGWLALRKPDTPTALPVAATPATVAQAQPMLSPQQQPDAPAATAVKPVTRPEPLPTQNAVSAPETSLQPVGSVSPSPGASVTAEAASARSAASADQTGGAAASPPVRTLPKLQGIFYRTQRPAALLDGKMVLIGGLVGEHRVTAISPNTVTLVRAGQTNVLTLD